MNSRTGHCGEEKLGLCREMNSGRPNPYAVTVLTRLPQLVFCMPSKDRMKGVDVEGSGLDLFYDALTMFEETENSRCVSKYTLLHI
jgi:hypothetical protein